MKSKRLNQIVTKKDLFDVHFNLSDVDLHYINQIRLYYDKSMRVVKKDGGWILEGTVKR